MPDRGPLVTTDDNRPDVASLPIEMYIYSIDHASHALLIALTGPEFHNEARHNLLSFSSGKIFFVCQLLHPGHILAIEHFQNGDMRHRRQGMMAINQLRLIR
jgi:hypothetical protein